jgi:hypothetical protein
MKEIPETHLLGLVTIEQDLKITAKIADFGIQISQDGRVWICIDGQAVIRFKPLLKQSYEDI